MITTLGHSPSLSSRRPARPQCLSEPIMGVSSNEWPCHHLEDHYPRMKTKEGRPHSLCSQVVRAGLIWLFPTNRVLGDSFSKTHDRQVVQSSVLCLLQEKTVQFLGLWDWGIPGIWTTLHVYLAFYSQGHPWIELIIF